ncbi:MAG: DNA repair protein RadA [Myxococcota bacterium]|nr:DNA repair protein RadA [Myxococcota bacterium]
MSRVSSKDKTVFACTGCGASSPRWVGRCATCGEWNTMVEERASARSPARSRSAASNVAGDHLARPTPIGEVPPDGAKRIGSGSEELDRVLGGGAVLGGVVLLGGDPGIGKSTLLMQVLAGFAHRGVKALYVTGEESSAQVAMRATRLALPGMDRVLVQATTDLEEVERAIDDLSPAAVVVDSIQTVRSGSLDSAAGSVGQLREVAARLVELAKRRGIALFLIGHVTKDGALAGPKVLEHLVDTVLSFEGDAGQDYRVVRASKNRFGPAHEMAVFEMVREGLREVPDPSALFLAERPERAPGSVVLPSAEGTRPVLIELQALVAPARMGPPRRVSTGIENSRLAILLAVLDRKADVHVLDQDVFASVTGGARVDERAADLAMAIAVVSSLRDRAIAPDLAVFGEVGLAGELRAVPRAGSRLQEARKMGFTKVILPRGNLSQTTPDERQGLELVGAPTLTDALIAAFE